MRCDEPDMKTARDSRDHTREHNPRIVTVAAAGDNLPVRHAIVARRSTAWKFPVAASFHAPPNLYRTMELGLSRPKVAHCRMTTAEKSERFVDFPVRHGYVEGELSPCGSPRFLRGLVL